MCQTCGVTVEQYDRARLVAHNSCVRSWYIDQGADPDAYGYHMLDPGVIATANDHIQRYHAAHPGRGLTREELLAEFSARGL